MTTSLDRIGRTIPNFILLIFVVAWSACDSTTSDNGGDPLQTTLAKDVPADPATGRDPNTGQPTGTTGRYTLYSLKDNAIVSSGTAPSPADSASAKWDIGFRSTSIIVNGGVSGPGQAAVIISDGSFEDMLQAPAAGYQQDSAQGTAVPGGSETGWYNYNPQAMLVTPIPGRFLVVRTADGKYAKVRFLSYYRGAPATPNPFQDQDRFYTFEFVYQPDGSRNLEASPME